MKNLTPHLDKIDAALQNHKAQGDIKVLLEIKEKYESWIQELSSIEETGKDKVIKMVNLLNEYKDFVEVEQILGKGTNFLKRQKGQLKLDNSIMEEFLILLMDKDILPELEGVDFTTGPQKAFMSLSFRPRNFKSLELKPDVVIKEKDQDFTLGKQLYYKLSPDESFPSDTTEEGKMMLAVVATECKVNYDKTMFQECSGTASRLKQGIPNARYYAFVEFLDMEAEDSRLTDIDNVFLIRHAKRLPYGQRNNPEIVREYRKKHPIDDEVIWTYLNEIKAFIGEEWYDPEEALRRGSFI